MRLPHILPLFGATSTLATNLFVSSYIGTISTLQLSPTYGHNYTLSTLSTDTITDPDPSWLTKDENNGVLYLANEGWGVPNGTMTSYRTGLGGSFSLINRLTVASGPVSSVVYNEGKALAVAHYSGSAVSTYNILPTGGLSPLQTFYFTLSALGPNPSRQEAPHPHEVILDPTKSFITVPDLGADLVRIFSINKKTSAITAVTPFKAPPGSGPRHGAFLMAGNKTWFFLISELANTIASYAVTYADGGMQFEQVFISGTFGKEAVPVGSAAAEVIVSPDHRFLLTSSRNASVFQIPPFPPSSPSSGTIPSDSLQVWSINPSTGVLTFEQLSPAGGLIPRQFSVNKNGTLAAVGLQQSARVVVIERDVETGKFGRFVGEVGVAGLVSSVIWDE